MKKIILVSLIICIITAFTSCASLNNRKDGGNGTVSENETDNEIKEDEMSALARKAIEEEAGNIENVYYSNITLTAKTEAEDGYVYSFTANRNSEGELSVSYIDVWVSTNGECEIIAEVIK